MTIDIGPAPRLRIYTSPGLYGGLLADLVSGRVAGGNDVATLEREVARIIGVCHAIAMPMARTGIYLALKHLIRPGQKVVLSPYTIADVINMVVCAGGRPVFADIDRETCNINAREAVKLIDDDTGAVLVTHFYGQVADMEPILAAARARNIPVIEDAAQAFGARIGNRQAGSVGKAGILSFGMYKNINSFLGGMIVTDDADLAARIRTESDGWPLRTPAALGKKVLSGVITDTMTWPPVFKTLSFRLFRWAFLNNVDQINNLLKIDVDPQLKRTIPDSYCCRMLPAQARLLLRQLPKLDEHTDQRIEAAKIYDAGLRDLKELIIPPLRTDRSHIYGYYTIQYADRQALVAHAMRKGRDITMSYHRNCAAVPCFAEYARPCPNAQATADQLIYLPTYPRYGRAEIEKTVAVIRSFFGK